MANEEREQLVEEANNLGLEFAKNISTKKLQAMVDEANGVPPPVSEPAPAGPAVKAESDVDAEADAKADKEKTNHNRVLSHRQKLIQSQREKAFKTRVVTITNKDVRDADVTTTAYLSMENQHFSISKLVPLDIPVELEECLIKVAKAAVITLHKDEIVGGKRTGNKVPTSVKKYAISYADQMETE